MEDELLNLRGSTSSQEGEKRVGKQGQRDGRNRRRMREDAYPSLKGMGANFWVRHLQGKEGAHQKHK